MDTSDADRGLETLGDRAMPGLERAIIGRWVMRAAFGASGRANSVWVVGRPIRIPPNVVNEVEQWYRQRSLQPRFMIFGDGEPELTEELDRRGYDISSRTVIMIGRLEAVVESLQAPSGAARWMTEVTSEPTMATRELMGDDQRMREVTITELPQRFVTVFDEVGDLLGGGLATIDDQWCGLSAMKTVSHARRRGVATAVLVQLARIGLALGASAGWLQVDGDNGAASSLYRRAAFGPQHSYYYRTAPAV